MPRGLLTLFLLSWSILAQDQDPLRQVELRLIRAKAEAPISYRTNAGYIYCTINCKDLDQRNAVLNEFRGIPDGTVTATKDPPTVSVVLPSNVTVFQQAQAESLRRPAERKAAQEAVQKSANKTPFADGEETWTSPGGLVYGKGSIHGNRLAHVMDHTVPNPTKPVHSIFNVPPAQVIGLVDEAWASRRGPGVLEANGYRVWLVRMGRKVGTEGQTAIQIVVRDGTREIITAYPK